jgi:hypothetical protein
VKHTLTLRERPAEPRSLLERNILTWAVVVQNITPRLSGKELVKQMAAIAFKRERAPEEWLIDAHLLVIGVRQIEEHLQYLKQVGFRTPQIKLTAKQFFAACRTADIKNLRDVLEHQAQYIAGKPKKPHLVVDPKQLVSFGDDAPGKEQAVWVSVFGKKCRIDPVVRAVAALEGALREGEQPLQESEDTTKTVTFGFPGTPLTVNFTEEHARVLLEWLLAHEENSDAHKMAVSLFRQAL